MQLCRDPAARRDIGDLVRKHIGTVLLDQSGAPALLPCGVVDLARDPAFGDFCLYNTVAHGQRHPVDRRVFRQRKDIAPLQPVCSRIDEMLLYHRSGHDTADGDIDLGCHQRRWRIIPRIDGTEQKLATPDIVQPHQPGRLRNGGHGRKDKKKDGQKLAGYHRWFPFRRDEDASKPPQCGGAMTNCDRAVKFRGDFVN